MRALSRRLDRIERARGGRACPCGGPRVAVVMGEEPGPEPCPRCGAEPYVVRLIRGVPPEGWKPQDPP